MLSKKSYIYLGFFSLAGTKIYFYHNILMTFNFQGNNATEGFGKAGIFGIIRQLLAPKLVV